MYQKYHTEAIVLRSYERGEADRVFALYTKEFGLVWARSSAVRRESSRQRYALQNNARVMVSLIRGTTGWRAVGASALTQIQDTAALAVFARAAKLVERLVGGEEQSAYLFTTLTDAHAALLREPRELHGAIELLCVARILYALGYLSVEAFHHSHASFSPENVRDPASPRQAPALRRSPTPVSLGCVSAEALGTALFTHTAFTHAALEEVEQSRGKLLSSVNKALSETHL